MFNGQSPSPHASGSTQNGRNNMDVNLSKFLYAHAITFNVLHSLYWCDMVTAINNAPKGYRNRKNDKPRTISLEKQKAKTIIL